MALDLEQYIRQASQIFAETLKSDTSRTQLTDFVKPIQSVEMSAEVKWDTFMQKAGTLKVIDPGTATPSFILEGGQSQSLIPKIFGTKVALTQEFMDMAIAGANHTDWRGTYSQKVDQIVNGSSGLYQHWINSRNKIMLSLLKKGKFELDTTSYDFKRPSDNTKTGVSGKKFDVVLKELLDAVHDKDDAPSGGWTLLCGNKFLEFFDKDEGVIKKREATNVNSYLNADNGKELFEGGFGIADYRVDGYPSAVKIIAYKPLQLSSSDGLPDNQAVLFSTASTFVEFFRGFNIKVEGQPRTRRVTGIGLSGLVESEPDAEYIRLMVRYFLATPFIHHTASVTIS